MSAQAYRDALYAAISEGRALPQMKTIHKGAVKAGQFAAIVYKVTSDLVDQTPLRDLKTHALLGFCGEMNREKLPKPLPPETPSYATS